MTENTRTFHENAVAWLRGLGAAALLGASLAAGAQPSSGTYTVLQMTPETALKAAQAALKKCRDSGYQVAVAVVDRGGVVQALLRDRFAGAHTPDTAIGKGWTAVSFRTNTTELAAMTQAGQSASGIRHLPGFVGVGGGMMVQARGTIVGGIGVSGAPGGDADDVCAKAGLDAIVDDLEF